MRTILTLALLAAVADAFAADAPMLPPAAADQVPQRLSALAAPKAAIERAPVSFSWALDPYAPLTAEQQPTVAESREYWQETDGAELQRGLDLATSAPGALIRISPVAGAAQVPAEAVQLRRAGQPVALARRNDAAQLQAAGLPVAAGSAAVQLADAAGPGRYALQVAQARGRYLVHVYEPHSPVRLHATLSRDRALAGGRSEIVVDLSDGPRPIADAQGSALLVAPSGRSWPVPLRRGRDGRLRAPVAVPGDAGEQPPGLWEVQVFAAAGEVQRDVRTALAVAQPTARLDGRYAFDPRRLSFGLPLRAASPGRYEVRGTLYASGPDRALRPVAIAHSAQWLDAGSGRIELAFERKQVPAGFGAPFELRQLELNDQSRLAPVERRERAARVGR